jgi:hypothetical protein
MSFGRSYRPLPSLLALLSSLALFALGQPAVAQNLVQNSRFDTDLTSWATYASSAPDPVGTGVAAWDAQDVDGDLASGSAGVDFAATPTGANAAFGISQCIDLAAVQPVTSAVFGTRFKLPTNQTADGGANVTIDVAFFAAAGCTGDLITGGSQGKTVLAAADLSDTVWPETEIVLPGLDITPLPSPLSAQLRLVARRVGTNSNTLEVFFDLPYFAVNGNVPVELLRWEVD